MNMFASRSLRSFARNANCRISTNAIWQHNISTTTTTNMTTGTIGTSPVTAAAGMGRRGELSGAFRSGRACRSLTTGHVKQRQVPPQMSSSPPPIQVLALAFQGLNILDLTGPAEVFGNSALRPAFNLTIASATPQNPRATKSAEGVTIAPDTSFQHLLQENAAQLARYDILVVPGAPPEDIECALKNDPGLLEVVKTFAGLPPKATAVQKLEEGGAAAKDRWLFSICTGAAFLGTEGVLGKKKATTHFAYLPILEEMAEKAGAPAEVVRKRWVDAGRTESGVRVVTSGGVSCGIDAALWILSHQVGLEKAKEVAEIMDYDWKFGGNGFTKEWIV